MEAINSCFVQQGKVYPIEAFEEKQVFGKTNIYEVIRIINRVPLFAEEHIDRLNNSLKLASSEITFNYKEVKENINTLINENHGIEGNIKIVVNLKEDNLLTTYYYIKHSYPSKEVYEEGVSTILFYGERENPNAKIINNNFRERVNEAIKENNAYEGILVDREGYITEGSRSNIFMVSKDQVITSPIDKVLPGITREMIIKLCKDSGIKVREERVKAEDVANLDGLFISGTSPKVLPIKNVNNYIYNSSKNDIITLIMKKYDEYSKNYIENYKL